MSGMVCPPGVTTSPCLGPEFVLDGCGDMRVRGANSQQWPYLLRMPDNNGLNVDPVQGVWTAPHGCYRWNQDKSASPAVVIPNSTVWRNAAAAAATLTPLTVVNPSACLPMLAVAWMLSEVTVNMGTGSYADHRASINDGVVQASGATVPTAGAVSTRPVGTALNPTNGVSLYGWTDRRQLSPVFSPAGQLVPPSGKVTYFPVQEVFSIGPGSGSTLASWRVTLNVMGVLVDPTQVNPVGVV